MFEVSVEYFDGREETHVFSTKKQVERFIRTVDTWNAEIWVSNGEFAVEWGDIHHFGW